MQWLWRALTRNLPLKLTALACAAVIWVYVDASVEIERTVEVEVALCPPLEEGVLACGWDGEPVLGGRHVPVLVTLRGPSRRLRTLSADSVWAEADSKRRFEPRHLVYGVYLRQEDFHIPGGRDIRVVDMRPHVIPVSELSPAAPPGEAPEGR